MRIILEDAAGMSVAEFPAVIDTSVQPPKAVALGGEVFVLHRPIWAFEDGKPSQLIGLAYRRAIPIALDDVARVPALPEEGIFYAG